MYVGKIFIVVALIALLAFCSCSKTATQANDYSFENLSDKIVNIDVYPTQADYFNNTNLLIHGTAKVRGYYIIPLSTFKTGQVYFVDIYSDDYLYNNWFWSNITLRDTFLPSQSDYDYIIEHTQYSDPSRLIWINGAGPTTLWKAFNSYNYTGGSYISTWSTLNAAQQNMQIVLHKSSFGSVTNGTGLDTTMKYNAFYDQASNISTLSFLNPDKSTYGTMKSYFNPSTFAFNGSKDTTLVYITGLGYFAMARQ